MSPQLKEEIWLSIFELLKKPLPARHAETAPPISSISESDLFACLQVNKQFYNLVTPMLYKTVVVTTDRLPSFLLRGKSIDNTIPKIDLLARTKILYIEYTPKEVNPEISYLDLFDYSVWESVAGGVAGQVERRDWKGIRDTRDLVKSWLSLLDKNGRPKQLLVGLETLVCGAIFGQQEELWRRLQGRLGALAREIHAAQRMLLNLTLFTPSIRHFSQAGSMGPMCLGATFISEARHNHPTIASHNYFPSPTLLPASIGFQSRWYMHTALDHPDNNKTITDMWARKNVEDALSNRQNFAMDRPFAETVPRWGLTGGVYRNMRVSDKVRAKDAVAAVIATAKRKLPPWIKAEDSWETGLLKDAPQCSACGWEPKA